MQRLAFDPHRTRAWVVIAERSLRRGRPIRTSRSKDHSRLPVVLMESGSRRSLRGSRCMHGLQLTFHRLVVQNRWNGGQCHLAAPSVVPSYPLPSLVVGRHRCLPLHILTDCRRQLHRPCARLARPPAPAMTSTIGLKAMIGPGVAFPSTLFGNGLLGNM